MRANHSSATAGNRRAAQGSTRRLNEFLLSSRNVFLSNVKSAVFPPLERLPEKRLKVLLFTHSDHQPHTCLHTDTYTRRFGVCRCAESPSSRVLYILARISTTGHGAALIDAIVPLIAGTDSHHRSHSRNDQWVHKRKGATCENSSGKVVKS
jgi:hypothetical protein